MGLLSGALHWLADPAHWSGSNSIPSRMAEHAGISLLSVLLAAAVAVPLGLYIGHTGKAEFLVVSVSNLGRAIPSFAILALTLPLTIKLGLGLGFYPTLIALFALAVPPILTNTYVGVQGVAAEDVEAARGMGMAGRQILTGLEVPLSAPLIVSGLRTAAVQVVATATLAALVAWGGLGRFIIDGFDTRDDAMILGGAMLVAGLAIFTELLFALGEKAVTPRTTSVAGR